MPLEGERRVLGQAWTPPSVTELMVDMVSPQDGEVVLEPGCGPAPFLAAARRWAAERGIGLRLRCVELDGVVAAVARGRFFEVEVGDFLRWGGRADVVLANPPYTRAGEYVVKTGAAPAYVRWVLKGLEVLRPGGRAAFLIPTSWLFSQYGEAMWRTLRSQTSRVSAVFLGKLWPDLEVRVMALAVEKGEGPPEVEARIDGEVWRGDGAADWPMCAFVDCRPLEALRNRLDVEVTRGNVDKCGDGDMPHFFRFTPEKLREWDRRIPGFAEAAKPFLMPLLENTDVGRRGRPARWLLVIPRGVEPPPPLLEYVRWGETECRTRKRGGRRCSETSDSLARARRFGRWYWVGDTWECDVAVPYIASEFRAAPWPRGYVSTDVMCVRGRVSPEWLNSPYVRAWALAHCGGATGVVRADKRCLKDLPAPPPVLPPEGPYVRLAELLRRIRFG